MMFLNFARAGESGVGCSFFLGPSAVDGHNYESACSGSSRSDP